MMATWLPLIGIVVFLSVVGCWRPWLQWRRYGSAGVLFLRSASWRQNLRDALGIVLAMGLVGQAIAAAGWPASLAPIGGLSQPEARMGQVPGAVVMFGGLGLLILAQLHLGASWRIGIAEGASPGLVTSGLYRFCRNPIFLAILITLTGYTALVPTRLSLVLLVGAFIGIRQQILTEEAYLLRTYGDGYRQYARRIGRFLPGIGKLR